MRLAVIIVAAAAILVLLHLGLLAAERRGWIFYRNRPRIQALGILEEVFQPSIQHVIAEETAQKSRREQADSGEPGETDGPPLAWP